VSRTWDAAAYHRVSPAMGEMALAVLDRLVLAGDETVLDAGCGTGLVTAELAARLPRGRVVGVDASPEMVARAREHLGDRVEVLQADLLELDLGIAFDAVFSTATFHWIRDHDRLFRRLHAALRPGGRLVAQCGGAGNIAGVIAAADAVAAQPAHREHFEGWHRPHNFAEPEQTERRLRAAGFPEARCWLHPNPIVPDDPLAYLATIPLGAHLDRLPAESRNAFVSAVADRLPDPITIDYVRLNIDATR
jgi:trans-aconitate 2-methyltransferase